MPKQADTVPCRASMACLVLSCFFTVHPLGGLFLAHAEAGLTLYRAEHHTPMGRVRRSYALEASRGIVRLLHMYCLSSTINAAID